MQIDGSESKVNRTGITRRPEIPFEHGEGEERQEPPAPPTLPEVNQDDGSTTGVVNNLNSEGRDRADREAHPKS